MIQNTTSYRIAFSMYVALGGDPNATFESVDAVYDAIDVLFGEAGQIIKVKDLNLDITENGNYTYNEGGVTGYKPVEVNVNIDTESYYNNGYNEGFTQGESEGYNDGYVEGLEDGAEDQKALLETITISENGTYTKEDGYKEVIVEVDIPVFETESLNETLTSNGTYDYAPTTDGYSDVHITVNVPTGGGSGGNGFDFTEIGYSQTLSDELNSETLNALDYSKELLRKWNAGEIDNTNPYQRFKGNKDLVYCPSLVFDNANSSGNLPTFLSDIFRGCTNLKVVGNLTFTKPIISCSYAFYGCTSLTSIPQLDTSNVTDMSDMFENCSALTSIPQLDTSKVTNMGYMFSNCSSLTSIPQLDTSKVTSMASMLYHCSSLTTIPQLDTSKVTNMYNMFAYCSSLTSIPQLDTSNVTSMASMISSCSALTTIPLLDCSNVNNMNYFYNYSPSNTITTLGGFKNLGMQPSVSGIDTQYFLAAMSGLTYESIMNVINNLYDRASAGMSTLTLKLNPTTMGLLSDADKAIATNKGWILA